MPFYEARQARKDAKFVECMNTPIMWAHETRKARKARENARKPFNRLTTIPRWQTFWLENVEGISIVLKKYGRQELGSEVMKEVISAFS